VGRSGQDLEVKRLPQDSTHGRSWRGVTSPEWVFSPLGFPEVMVKPTSVLLFLPSFPPPWLLPVLYNQHFTRGEGGPSTAKVLPLLGGAYTYHLHCLTWASLTPSALLASPPPRRQGSERDLIRLQLKRETPLRQQGCLLPAQ